MQRRSFLQVITWFGLAFGGGTALVSAASCYDAHSPNLPPCDSKHPDNSAGCWDHKTGPEGGKDASDAS